MTRYLFHLIGLFIWLGLAGCQTVVSDPIPTVNPAQHIIFHNGIVLTMDVALPQAQAVAITGEKITAVGSNDDILAQQRADSVVVDLNGRTLMPGFVDPHTHLFNDAEQYRAAWTVYRDDPSGLERPAYDRTLAPLVEAKTEKRPVLYPGDLAKEIHRALNISKELGFPLIVYGAHQGYEVAETLAERKVPVVINLKWPEKERNADPEEEESLRVLRLRDRAAGTPAAFEKAGVKFAFYSGEIRSAAEVLPKVRTAIDKGLSPEAALRALTLSTAEIYGVENRLGSLATGKIANLVVTEGDLLAEKPKLKMVFVDGQKFDIRPPRAPEPEDRDQQGDKP